MLITPNATPSALRIGVLSLMLWFTSLLAATAQNLTLYMVEQPGCIYCAQWDAEVGDAYHLTTEGRAAPLNRLQLRDPLPDGLSFARKVAFTPTFVLVRDSQELERIEGYPGEDFFYGMLGMMLNKAGVSLE
jgi:hypothetical protein